MVNRHSRPRGIILLLPSTRQRCARGVTMVTRANGSCAQFTRRKEEGTVKCYRSDCDQFVLLISNTRKQLESIVITITPIVTFPPSARPDSDADHLFMRAK